MPFSLRGLMVAMLCLQSGAALAQAQTSGAAAINAAVAKCVAVARKFPDQFGMSKGFDAFFNPATGSVENNAFLQGQQPALFEFNKCMAASGYPLGTASTKQ